MFEMFNKLRIDNNCDRLLKKIFNKRTGQDTPIQYADYMIIRYRQQHGILFNDTIADIVFDKLFNEGYIELLGENPHIYTTNSGKEFVFNGGYTRKYIYTVLFNWYSFILFIVAVLTFIFTYYLPNKGDEVINNKPMKETTKSSELNTENDSLNRAKTFPIASPKKDSVIIEKSKK